MLVCVGACQCSKSVGFHGVGIAEHACILGSGEEGREIERAQKRARSPPASGARARGEMDAGGLACAAIANCLRTFVSSNLKSCAAASPFDLDPILYFGVNIGGGGRVANLISTSLHSTGWHVRSSLWEGKPHANIDEVAPPAQK